MKGWYFYIYQVMKIEDIVCPALMKWYSFVFHKPNLYLKKYPLQQVFKFFLNFFHMTVNTLSGCSRLALIWEYQ